MSQQQMVDLDKRGHGIGNHTMTHVPLARVDHDEMFSEISQGSAVLESWLGHPCLFFAWTYSWNQLSDDALKVGQAHHRYCFSPCSGLNSWPSSERLLWRTGVDVSKPVSNLKSQLSGVVDRMCRPQRQRLSSMWKRTTQ